MVKIESLSKDAEAVFVRADRPHKALAGYVLTPQEFATFKILKGSVTYSIDELEVVTVAATVEDSIASLKEPAATEVTEEPVVPTKSQTKRSSTLKKK